MFDRSPVWKRCLEEAVLQEASTVSAGGALLRSDGKKRHEGRSLQEAQFSPDARKIECVIISEGPGNAIHRNYYTRESIHSLAKLINGWKCYINHDSPMEMQARPEGDIWKLAGFWSDGRVEQVKDPETGQLVDGVVATLNCDGSEAGKEAYAKAEASVKHQEMFPDSDEVYAGISINSDGLQEGSVDVDGMPWDRIIAFAPKGSGDIVTEPARGGTFRQVLESVQSGRTISKAEAIEMSAKARLIKKLQESMKPILEAEPGDDKAIKAKADLVDKAINDVVGGLKMPGEEKAAEQGAVVDPDEVKEAQTSGGLTPELLEAMKVEMPLQEGETEQDYMDKVGRILAMAPGATEAHEPGKPAAVVSQESKSILDKFRTANPGRFKQVMEAAREKLGAEHKDFKVLRESNKQLAGALIEAKGQLRIHSDMTEGTKLLQESDIEIPEAILKASDMIGLDTPEKERRIESVKAMLESSGAGVSMLRTQAPSSGSNASGYDEGGLSLPTVATKESDAGK